MSLVFRYFFSSSSSSTFSLLGQFVSTDNVSVFACLFTSNYFLSVSVCFLFSYRSTSFRLSFIFFIFARNNLIVASIQCKNIKAVFRFILSMFFFYFLFSLLVFEKKRIGFPFERRTYNFFIISICVLRYKWQ